MKNIPEVQLVVVVPTGPFVEQNSALILEMSASEQRAYSTGPRAHH